MNRFIRRTSVALGAAVIINLTACASVNGAEGKTNTPEDEPSVMIHTQEDMTGDEAGAQSGGPAPEADAPVVPEIPEEAVNEADNCDVAAMTLQDVIDEAGKPEVLQKINEYFADTLFIGDSRTVGMSQYADISTADYFCATGMSVYNLFKENTKAGADKITLDAQLGKKTYGKIYLMLGINELGYNIDSIVKKYNAVIDRINELQPEAQIVLQANMHVTQARSEKDEIYNNPRINALNECIAKIASDRGLGYVDVNPVFDDAGGNLSTDYTFDHTHVLGKYYRAWGAWLYLSAHSA